MFPNPYEPPHVVARHDPVSKARSAIAMASYMLMAIAACGFVYALYHDWSRVGFQMPHHLSDWFLMTIWFLDIIAFYVLARGVQEHRPFLTTISLVPILISIGSVFVLAI